MKAYSASNIRNIALAGHGGHGKTSLAEAMLYLAKATDRLGRIADGNTVMDFDAEEKRRLASVSLGTAALEWNGSKLNLLDTPGLFDFAGELYEGVRAAETVLVVTSAGDGISVGAEKAFKAASTRDCAVAFAVTKCDAENHDFSRSFEALQKEYGSKICPVVIPIQHGEQPATGYVDFLSGKAYQYDKGKAVEIPVPADGNIDAMREVFKEAASSGDDDLIEKFLMEEELTPGELAFGLAAGMKSGSLYPVFACGSYNAEAIDLLLNGLAAAAPSAADKAGEAGLACDEAGPVAAICFKTVADPFVGKMSFFKVISGKLSADIPAFNARTGESERMGKIISLRGSKQEDVSAIPAGDVGVVTKLAGFRTGDTLCAQKDPVSLEGVAFPAPCLSMAVNVRKKGEEEKVASGMARLQEEDPTCKLVVNSETREQVISGLGDQHLDVITSKLKAKFGVEVDLAVPRVAYRETIRKKVEAQGRHKKQTGGHGQFGDVYIRYEPCEEDFVFAEEVVGGTVPRQYFPAVEKGLRECVAKGFLAGYPMVGLKATLYFGSYHPVDSSEMAFKTAAHLSFKNAMPNAAPTILEPIGTLKAYMPDDNLGDVMGDITKRRGRVLGMGAADEPKMQELVAEVPMAEMGDFSTMLRSVSAGRGHFAMEFARYEDAPAAVAAKVIEEAAKRKEAEEKE